MNDEPAPYEVDPGLRAVEVEAVRQALHFLTCLHALAKAREGQPDSNCPRESGALRRASMDLTRALADMRKPR